MDARRSTLSRLAGALLGCSLLFLLAGCGDATVEGPEPEPHFDYPLDDVLRLQHVQVKATHNSYHVANPDLTGAEYSVTHAPLDVQLAEQGVRMLELDLDYDPDTEVFRILHTPLIDELSTCPTLDACLQIVKDFSDAHRAHMPIAIQIEIKDPAPSESDAELYFDKMHAVIRSVWPDNRIVTPDMVRGDHATLADAMAAEGWPTLGAMRGRVIFMLYNRADTFGLVYSRNGTDLSGRLAFTRPPPGDALATWLLHDDATVEPQKIEAALLANMVVRTRAEIDIQAAKDGDTTLRDAAIAAGVHFVTTDFPVPVDGSSYSVDIEGGTPARCNPRTAPPECTSEAIEDPRFMNP